MSMRLERSHAVAIAVGAGSLALDQATKAVFESWDCGDVICPLRNHELMLGIVGGSVLQVILASIAGLALFAGWVWLASKRAPIPAVAIALVVSGIVGNLVDRLALGSVRDFFDFPGNTVINVADVSLIVGVLIAVGALIVGMARDRPDQDVNAIR